MIRRDPFGSLELREFYKTSQQYFAQLQAKKPATFGPFCDLVRQFNVPDGIVLEVAAGAGQAASTLAATGTRVVAMDLSHLFLSRARDGRRQSSSAQPHLVTGDGTQLPFAAESCDVVCMHDAVEHITDQEALWTEVARVLRTGGHLVVVGPNLLSPVNPLVLAAKELRSGRLRLDLASAALKLSWSTMRKLLTPDSGLQYRAVIVRDDMHSDADACYLASPIDLLRILERHGCKVIRYQRGGRTRVSRVLKRLMGSFAPTIWIVAVRDRAMEHA
jgi:SAM-dependent methyltransferase